MRKVQQSLLRTCINHGTMDYELLDNILDPLCELHNVTKPDLKILIKDINKDIEKYGQKLSLEKFSLTGKELLVFAWTQDSQVLKHHPTLTDEECKYFRDLLHKMVQSENYGIPWHQSFAMAQDGSKPLTKKRMEELLDIWKQQGYFFEKHNNDDDKLYVGPRTIVEFGFHLRKNYLDYLQDCPLCKKLTFWDVHCESCNVRVHGECMRKYLRTRSNCPACNQPWTTRLSL